ncbi:MAG: NUDIX domain-containing protein [Fidelibacterota bacterium]
MELEERRRTSEQVYSGRLLKVYRDTVELPNGRLSDREYIKHPGAVVIIPLLPDDRLMLIRQYRYPMGKILIELPAGKLDPGESKLDTARRELEEETGYRSESFTELAEIHPCIGYSDEKMWLYLATDLIQSRQQTDQDEFIELLPVAVPDALKMVWSGQITDVKTIIGILWCQRYLETQS